MWRRLATRGAPPSRPSITTPHRARSIRRRGANDTSLEDLLFPYDKDRPRPSARRAVGLAAAGANSTVMGGETRLERRLDKWIARATTPRGAAVVIASVTTVMTVVTGLLMTVIDHDNFPSLGGGLWWAIQTVTTVGYGDAVPENTGGRLMAALVMLLGIGFITVITAAITGTFVARVTRQPQAGSGDPSGEHLVRIDERLERIEAALRERR